MKNIIRHILSVSAVIMLLGGCVKDQTADYGGQGATITLNLSVPYGADGGTRTITATPDEENRIDDIAVLALTEKSGDVWVFDYMATDVTMTIMDNDMTVTAKVRAMSRPQQFVVIANGETELAVAAPVRNELIDDIEQRLICSTGGGEWPARNNGTGTFTPIPMYARTDAKVVSQTNNAIGDYQMLRMVARIDVTLKSGINNFILDDACLFNYKTAGYVSYGRSTFSDDRVYHAAVPASGDHTGVPIKEPTVYFRSDKSADIRGTILNSIYTFESPAITNEAGKTKGTALVVGGWYNGAAQTPANKSYYRIDFTAGADRAGKKPGEAGFNPAEVDYIPLWRNHRYTFSISAVRGKGYDNFGDALRSLGMMNNLQTELLVVNESKINNTVFNSKHYLGLGDEVTLKGFSGSTGAALCVTNYSYGWEFDASVFAGGIEYDVNGSGWLTAVKENSGDSRRAKIALKATADNPFPGPIRTAYIHVKAGTLTHKLKVTQERLPTLRSITPNTYVGAFWRADQTGERLIKIPVLNGHFTTGEWSVEVLEYGDFIEGDILFSTAPSADPGITWDLSESPADMRATDATNTVGGNATTVSGTAVAGGDIFFRIGLRSDWNSSTGYTAEKPCRYAVLMLKYNNGQYYQKLYLRQGHEADYLMRPEDTGGSGESWGSQARPKAKKFSPYNLTSDTWSDAGTTGYKGGKFTDYPTQAGAFFQFSPLSGSVYAYHPTMPNDATVPVNWQSGFNQASWDAINGWAETCPPDYRRPNDGSTTAASTGAVTESEVRQSLWLNPKENNSSNTDNSVWGYYADGFFDRRSITTQPANVKYDNGPTAVSINTSEVAYVDRLHYNPATNAAVFLPASGLLSSSERHSYPGEAAYLWTSGNKSTLFAWTILDQRNTSKLQDTHRTQALPVRCVAE